MKQILNVKMSNYEYFCWLIKQNNIWPEDWEDIVFDDELSEFEKVCLIRLANGKEIC